MPPAESAGGRPKTWRERATRAVRVRLRDGARNRRWASAEERFLVVRHTRVLPDFYDVLLDWLEEHFPTVRSRFELRVLPCRPADLAPYRLCLPWLQDPVQQWSPRAYRQAVELTDRCRAEGIPVINPVDRLTNATRLEACRRLTAAGIRTPRVVAIDDAAELRDTLLGLSLPLLIRNDWGHQRRIHRVDQVEQLVEIPIERMTRPVAVELVDARGADGLFRKYRSLAAGDVGVSLAIHVTRGWLTRGGKSTSEHSEELVAEELAYQAAPDPHHDVLQRAREALELDFVAFDYGYDQEGRLVIWEGNPFPHLHFNAGRRRYRRPAVERALAAMTRLYLTRAGLDVPGGLEELLAPMRIGRRSETGSSPSSPGGSVRPPPPGGP